MSVAKHAPGLLPGSTGCSKYADECASVDLAGCMQPFGGLAGDMGVMGQGGGMGRNSMMGQGGGLGMGMGGGNMLPGSGMGGLAGGMSLGMGLSAGMASMGAATHSGEARHSPSGSKRLRSTRSRYECAFDCLPMVWGVC